VNIFHAALEARSFSYFGWWSPPEPLLEPRVPPKAATDTET